MPMAEKNNTIVTISRRSLKCKGYYILVSSGDLSSRCEQMPVYCTGMWGTDRVIGAFNHVSLQYKKVTS